jgi:hypothetical protein
MAIVVSFAICRFNRIVQGMAFVVVAVVVFANNEYIGSHNDRSWKYRVYKGIAEALNNGGGGEYESIACSEIGVIKYYYRGPIIDAIGLVTPGQAEHLKSGDPLYYIEKYRPHYLVLNCPPKNATENVDLRKYNEIGTSKAVNRMIKIYEVK